MNNSSDSPGVYEQVIVYSFFLFKKSLLLYQELSEQVISKPEILRRKKTQAVFRNITSTIKTCGHSLECLPEAKPDKAELFDQSFRVLGREIRNFSGIMERLLESKEQGETTQLAWEIRDCASKIMKNFHVAVERYELIYPGRLTKVIQTYKNT